MTRPQPEIEYLDVDDLLRVAEGVLDELLVRDVGLLASAAARPQTTVFGEDAYRTFAEQAAALMHSLARTHPLVDGNKRLAWSATRVFCLLNGYDVVFTTDDAEQLVLAVATGAIDVTDIAATITTRLSPDPR